MIKDIIENNENKSINQDRINQLKQIIPNCFDKNGNIDIELLKKEFDSELNFTKESFELNFLGKSYAKMISGLDTETVIEPDIKHNSKEENTNSQNVYISGDNIDALKHLVKTYQGKIKCIYIDPPYNTGKDGFTYNDNYKYTKEKLIHNLDISEEEAQRILNMTNGSSNSHSAWLTFMYPRLYLAKQLLNDSGIICISIDDNEVYNLKHLCDSIFGEENFISNVIWKKKVFDNNDELPALHEYLLIYTKNRNNAVFKLAPRSKKQLAKYKNPDNDPKGPYYLEKLSVNTAGGRYSQATDFKIINPKNGKEYTSITGNWRFGKNTIEEMIKTGRIDFSSSYPRYRVYLNEVKDGVSVNTWWDEISNIWDDCGYNLNAANEMKELFGCKVFDNPKPVEYIKKIISLICDKNDIVLDFFSGSATTAHAVMDLNAKSKINLKYILVQISDACFEISEAARQGYKTIDEVGQERIKRAAKKIKEKTNANIDYGFKHYTLKETSDKVLNKLEQFNPDIINENYNLYEEYGIDTILETWKLKDGYEFTTNIKTIDCKGYNVYKCEECLYLVEPNITIKNIEALLELYSKDEKFTSNKLVLFGYSFKFNELEMIKNNIKQVKNFKNIDVKIYTRY